MRIVAAIPRIVSIDPFEECTIELILVDEAKHQTFSATVPPHLPEESVAHWDIGPLWE